MRALTRDDYCRRFDALKQDRASWLAHWRELNENILPRTGSFLQPQNRNNAGAKKHNAILKGTATRAVRILGAGLMAGATSPARPWIRFATADADLNEASAVKVWLSEATSTVLRVFQKSNTYRALHTIYEELGVYGTGASFMQDDFDSVIHHHTLTAGEFAIATNYKGEVCTLYREFTKTVSEVVREFGIDNCSATVKSLFDGGGLDKPVPLLHLVEPREDRDSRKSGNRNMPWRSMYYELGADGDRCLREGGYKSFPVLAPRWATSAGNAYGDSPAMDALGDIKQLQHQQKRKLQAIDYQANPPLQVPTSLRDQVDRLPGGISYYDPSQPAGGIRNAFEVNLNLADLREDQLELKEAINEAFYADLFLMLANGENPQMTATEVAERHEEKMLMLGPVLERLHNELLEPVVERTFDRCLTAGLFPVPPPELQEQELQIEFVSVLAQAQRAIATNGIDRYVMSLGQIATIKPEVLDRFDADRWADVYADALGVDPTLVVPTEKAAIVRKARAEALTQKAQADQAQQAAQTVSHLATAVPPDAMSQLTGYTGG